MRRWTMWMAVLAAGIAAGCDGGNPDGTDSGTADVPVTDGTTDALPDDATDAVSDAVVPPPSTVRFLHVSDLHYRVEEGEARDDARLQPRVDLLNALPGDFDLAVFSGDNFDHVLPAWHADPAHSPMSWYVDVLDGLRMPWVASIGNHEFYDYFGDVPVTTSDGAARRAAFSAAMGMPMDFVREVNGVRMIVMDSMEEGTWGETHGLMGRFSEAQMDWLRTQLSTGKPSFLFFHHPPTMLAPMPDDTTLCDVLSQYPGTVKGIFTGHMHYFWKATYCDTPFYIVQNFSGGADQYYEVEYDIASDTVTLLNEAAIPFPVLPQFECAAGESTVATPEAGAGTVQQLVIENGVSDASGIGEMLGSGLSNIPFVLAVDRYTDGAGFATRLTIASRWETDGFLTYVDGSPCEALDLVYREGIPCFEGGPVHVSAQLIPFLTAVGDDPVDPSWQAVLEIRDLDVAGKIGNDGNGVPIIADGIVTATLLRDPTLMDLKEILVGEYCKGTTDGCPTPGANGLPACPQALDTAAVDGIYAGIQYRCDFQIVGFGMQSIIDMVAMLPETVHLSGDIRSQVLVPTATVEGGGNVSSGLFDTAEGRNCAVPGR